MYQEWNGNAGLAGSSGVNVKCSITGTDEGNIEHTATAATVYVYHIFANV